MVFSRLLLTMFVLAQAACSSHAATTTATPATFKQVLEDARSGDRIILAPGDYAPVFLKGKDWTPSVEIVADGAKLSGVQLRNVSGLTWRGGVFDGGDRESSGIGVADGSRLVIENTRMSHFRRNGIGMGRVSDIRITGNVLTDMGSDGIQIGWGRRIVIDRNTCRDFLPTEKAHADCIQLWSSPIQAPTADVTITNNIVHGRMMGITMFNHIRKGIDDGGFDRITVANNDIRITTGTGISMMECRECVARDNFVDSLPNSQFEARINIRMGGSVMMCGNKIVPFPRSEGQQRCKP